MSRRLVVLASSVALAALPLVSLLTPTAHARAWAKWAPAPLASDSSYLAAGMVGAVAAFLVVASLFGSIKTP